MINEDNIEELLKAAQGTIEEKSVEITSTHSQAFALSLSIKSGSSMISNLLIYQHYLDWCEQNKKKPQVRKIFFKEFKKLGFKHGIRDGYRFYKLTGNSFDLSDEYREKAKEVFEKEKKRSGNRRVW